MKKNIIGALAVVVAMFSLASCKNNKDTLMRRTDESYVAAAKSEIANLSTVKTGQNIYTKEDNATAYYEIRVSNDIKSTLFVTTVELNPIFKEHGAKARELTVYPLMYYSDETNPLTDSEKSAIITSVMSTENAVAKASLGFEANYGTKWGKSVKLTDAYKTYTSSTTSNQKLAVVYLPTYVNYFQNGSEYLSLYVMVPLYTEICEYTGTTASSTAIAQYNEPTLTYNGLYLA